MTMRIGSLFFIITCGWILAFGSPVAADDPPSAKIYEWQDQQGVLHISDSLEKVPAKYRSSVKTRNIEVSPEQEQAAPEQSPGTKQTMTAPTADNEEQLKKAWQQRMHEARENVTRLTEQLQSQETQLRILQDRGGSGQYFTAEMADQVKQLEEQIKDTKNALEQSRKALEEDIPDAARKAGIPPGWLRE